MYYILEKKKQNTNTSLFQISTHLFQEPSIYHFRYTLKKTERKSLYPLSAPINTKASENFFMEAIFLSTKIKRKSPENTFNDCFWFINDK